MKYCDMKKMLQQLHIKSCAILSIILFVKANIKADEVINLKSNVDLQSPVVVTALFEKVNWLIRELGHVDQKLRNFNKEVNDQEALRKTDLQTLKSEVNELLLQRDLKFEKLMEKVKQEALKKFSEQESLKKSNLQSLKMEVRQILLQQDLKTEKLLWDLKEDTLKNFELQGNLLRNASNEIKEMKQMDVNELKQNRNWQSILRRQDGSINFDRNWIEYKTGFGNLNGEFFIGLEKLHAMTTYADPQELLIILEDFDNHTHYAKYDEFLIGSEAEDYKIKHIGKFHGDVYDEFSVHENYSFSTSDHKTTTADCAKQYKGGWWYSSCYFIHLTGVYITNADKKMKGLIGYSWQGNNSSLKYAEMMIRPKSWK